MKTVTGLAFLLITTIFFTREINISIGEGSSGGGPNLVQIGDGSGGAPKLI